jgi:hypothetical protein
MMYHSQKGIVDFGKIVFISTATFQGALQQAISYSPDQVFWVKTELTSQPIINFNGLAMRYLKLANGSEFTIDIQLASGYLAYPDEAWTQLFQQRSGWTGGDGLYTFNLFEGIETLDMKDAEVKTMMVFGDTLVSTLHPQTHQRLEPLVMPNSSIAIMEGVKPTTSSIQFLVNQNEKGHMISFMEPTVDLAYQGTIAAHLTREGFDSGVKNPWVSSYHPNKPIVLTFDFKAVYPVDHLEVTNYFYPEFPNLDLQKRGIKTFQLWSGSSLDKLTMIQEVHLPMSSVKEAAKVLITLPKHHQARFMQFIIPHDANGYYGGVGGHEGLFGLNHVRFYVGEDYLRFVSVDANSELFKASKQAHYWLQDGVIVGDRIYFFPLVVAGDPTGPEGFQFKIEGIAMLEVPLENHLPKFSNIKQHDTNFYLKDQDGRDWYWGAGIFTNTEAVKAVHPDGYIYIYGYTFLFAEIDAGRKLRVARVKPENFANLNEWRYFDGDRWQTNPQKAKSILDHVSCEMSVHFQDGQYVAVFTYDVQSPYLAYATAPTPWGPFTAPRIVYVAPDRGKRIYQYNAKAHPHLSSTKDGMLVSYNQNTASMDENMSDGRIYGPRFLRLRWHKGGQSS